MLCEAPTRSLICGARSCKPAAERSSDATGERFMVADDFIRFGDIVAISSGPLLSLVDLEKLQLRLMANASVPTLLLCSIQRHVGPGHHLFPIAISST